MATQSYLARVYEEIFFGEWWHYTGRLSGQDADDLILDACDYVDMRIIAEVLWTIGCARRYPWDGPSRVEGG